MLRLKGLQPIFKRNFRKTQWPGYTFDMEQLSDPMVESNAYKILQDDAEIGVDDLNNMATYLHEDVEETLNVHCPRTEYKPRIPGFGWWNHQIGALKRKVRRIKNNIKNLKKGKRKV